MLLKRVFRGVAAVAAGQALNILFTIILVPLYLAHWSAALYGEWMALSSVVAYLGLMDFGMNSAAGNAMTAAHARKEWARYREIQASAMVFYFFLALIITIGASVFALDWGLPAWMGIRNITGREAGLAVLLLAVRLAGQMPAGQLASIYRTTGNFAATQWIGNAHVLVWQAGTIAILWYGGGVLALAAGGVLTLLAVTALVWALLRRNRRELLPRMAEASLASIRQLLRPSLLFGGIMSAMAIGLHGPVLITSHVLGGAAVALLVTTRTLTNTARQAVTSLTVAIWPELTRLDATGASETLRIGLRLLSVVSACLCAAFFAALWFEGGEVISVWSRGKLVADVWLLRLFLLSTLLQSPWLAASIFTTANNRHRTLSAAWLAAAVAGLSFTWATVPRLGLWAVPVGTMAGEAIACYHFVIKDTCDRIGQNYRSFAARVWICVAVAACAALAGAWAGHTVALGPAIARWMETGGSALAASAVAGWLCLETPDRAALRSSARRFSRKSGPTDLVCATP